MKRSKDTHAIDDKLVGLQDNMFSFALSLTSNREVAEDLMQETSLKVLSNRDKYRENTNFKGWVFTVMRNLFINNYHRLVRTRNIIDSSTDTAYVGGTIDSAAPISPDQTLSITEINKAIENLSKDLKSPFSMYISGYKYKEIAEALDLPIGTVKSRIFFARKQLQQALAEYSR